MSDKLTYLTSEVQCEPFNFQILLDDINLNNKKKPAFLTPQYDNAKQSQRTRLLEIEEDFLAMKFNEAYKQINGIENPKSNNGISSILKSNPFSSANIGNINNVKFFCHHFLSKNIFEKSVCSK